MSAKGIRAGKAYAELGIDDSRFTKGLKAAQAKLQSWGIGLAKIGGIVAGAGTAITGPLAGAVMAAASAGDELNKMADRTGASVESLSELKHAASQSDVEFAALGKGLQKMQRNMIEAGDGNKTAAEGFEKLGLSVNDLLAMSPDKQFETIAQKISELEDPAARTAAAMDIFGKSGADMLPLFVAGAAGIQTLREEAKALGLQVSTKDAQAATLFGDTWANVQAVAMDVVKELGFALLPILTQVMQAIIPMIVTVAQWISDNRQLIVTIAAVAAGLVAAGTAIAGLGGFMVVAGMAIGGLISVAGTLAAVFGAIISPLGLVVAGVVAGTAAFLTMTDTGQAIVNWFGENFGKLLQVVQDTVGGIFSAMQNGRLDVAAKIAFTGIKLAIATVMESVLGVFGSSIEEMMRMLAGLWKRISEVMAHVNVARQHTTNWISSALNNLGVGTGDDARGDKLEQERLRIMREKGIATSGNDTSSAANLSDIQQRDLAAAEQGLATAQAMDPDAMASAWAQAWDVEALQAELEGLRADAQKPADVRITDLDVPGLDAIQQRAAEGVDEAAKGPGMAAAGTFSAAQAAAGVGGFQARMLTAAERTARNTDPKNQPKLALT